MSHGAQDDVELGGAEVAVGEVQLLHCDHGRADVVCLDVAKGNTGKYKVLEPRPVSANEQINRQVN